MRRLGIRGKLLLLAMAAVGGALVVAAVVLTAAERWRLEGQLRQDQAALARIVADNVTASLTFADPRSAGEVLRSLRAKRHVVTACVYDRDGDLFAAYRRAGAVEAGCPPEPTAAAAERRAHLVPVVLGDREIGRVLLRSDRAEIVDRLRLQGLVLLGALTVAAVAAFLLSLRLRRLVSEPVAELARTALAVSRQGDFSLRAHRRSDDELGDLVTAFNEMLAQIESRDIALVAANEELRHEVAERQRAEEEKADLLVREKEARRDAEASSRLKDEFLATLSHELRTPLNAILGWAAMLRARPDDAALATRAGEVVERNATAQARLVADLLDVSAIVTGKMRLEPQRLELGPVVAAVEETVRPAADGRQVTLEVDLEPGLPPVSADTARLQQALWNLLANAVKFSPPGGRVRLAARRVEGDVEIEVRDEGIGIPEDFLPFVFDRFRQRDASTTRQHGGLGLGLALVRHIVEAHGGSVAAESAGEGRGATFRIRLPTVAQPAPRPEDGAAAPSAALSGLRVLVVEDALDSAEFYRDVLAAEGVEVRLASTVAAARRAFAASPPDVLLCDIGLPGEDGYALARWVRELPAERGGTVPAAALTAYAGDGDARRALDAGFDLHLAKPLPPDRLVAAVAELSGRVAASG